MKKIITIFLLCIAFVGCNTFQRIYGPGTLLTKSKKLNDKINKLDSTKYAANAKAAVDELNKIDDTAYATNARSLRTYNCNWRRYNRRINRFISIVSRRPYLNSLSTQLTKLANTLNKKQLHSTSSSTKKTDTATVDSSSADLIKLVNKELTTTRKLLKDSVRLQNAHPDSLAILKKLLTKQSSDSAWLAEVKNIINPDSIAPNKFTLLGATYTNINSVPDDDAPGFTQYYAYISIPLKETAGLDKKTDHWVWFRNIYFQPAFNFSSATNQIRLLDTTINNKTYRYANKLDVLQYAFIKTPVELNLFTYIAHNGVTDYFHVYGDLMGGLLITKDTINKQSGLVTSGMWGIHLSAKTESGVSKKFTFETGIQLFGMHTSTDAFSLDLNPQYRHYHEDTLVQNSLKPFTANNLLQIYYNIDFLAEYNLNLANTGSTAFLHLTYYSNLAYPFFYHNSYFQVQLGTTFDLVSIFSSPSTSSSKSNSGTSKKGS